MIKFESIVSLSETLRNEAKQKYNIGDDLPEEEMVLSYAEGFVLDNGLSDPV